MRVGVSTFQGCASPSPDARWRMPVVQRNPDEQRLEQTPDFAGVAGSVACRTQPLAEKE